MPREDRTESVLYLIGLEVPLTLDLCQHAGHVTASLLISFLSLPG